MKHYEIYEKASGAFIMPAQLAELVELGPYTFDKYEYREVIQQPDDPLPSSKPPVFGGVRKLTKLQWRKLLLAEEEEAFDEIRATVETMQLPAGVTRAMVRTVVNRFNEATIMDLDDPDQARGFGLLVVLGKMAPYRIKEILNG